MKKYFLTVMGNFDDDNVIDIAMSLGEVVDSPKLNFQHQNTVILYHFESCVNKLDLFTFIKSVLIGITETFILTEVEDGFTISLSNELKPFILDLENGEGIGFDDTDLEDELDEEFDDIISQLRKVIKPNAKKYTLDSILDKINEEGINSLTTDEKFFLENYNK